MELLAATLPVAKVDATAQAILEPAKDIPLHLGKIDDRPSPIIEESAVGKQSVSNDNNSNGTSDDDEIDKSNWSDFVR